MAFPKGHKPWNTGKKGVKIGFAVIPQPEINHNKGKKKENYAPLMSVSRKMRGKNNHAWKGGIVSKLRNIKRKVKKTFCQKCKLKLLPCQLDIDHKDGNRKNNRKKNLWTICANCHRLKTLLNKDHSHRYGKWKKRKI